MILKAGLSFFVAKNLCPVGQKGSPVGQKPYTVGEIGGAVGEIVFYSPYNANSGYVGLHICFCVSFHFILCISK